MLEAVATMKLEFISIYNMTKKFLQELFAGVVATFG
jgi:hypothetical protein